MVKKVSLVFFLLICIVLPIVSMIPLNSNLVEGDCYNYCQNTYCHVPLTWGVTIFVPWVKCGDLFNDVASTHAYHGYCVTGVYTGGACACTCYGAQVQVDFCWQKTDQPAPFCDTSHTRYYCTGDLSYSHGEACDIKSTGVGAYNYARCVNTNVQLDKNCSRSNAFCNSSTGRCSCQQNYGDCDSNWNNGCETYLLNNNQHCGRCFNNCANQGTSCQGSHCIPCTITSAVVTPQCPLNGNIYNCNDSDMINISMNVVGPRCGETTRALAQFKNFTSTITSDKSIPCSFVSNQIKCSFSINSSFFSSSELQKLVGLTSGYENKTWNVTTLQIFNQTSNGDLAEIQRTNLINGSNQVKFRQSSQTNECQFYSWYTINRLHGPCGYTGSQTCVTNDTTLCGSNGFCKWCRKETVPGSLHNYYLESINITSFQPPEH